MFSPQCKKIILCFIYPYLVFQSHLAGRGFSLSQFVKIRRLRKPLSQGVSKKWIWEGNIWIISFNMKKKLILLLFVSFTNGGKLCNDIQSKWLILIDWYIASIPWNYWNGVKKINMIFKNGISNNKVNDYLKKGVNLSSRCIKKKHCPTRTNNQLKYLQSKFFFHSTGKFCI